MITVGMNYEVRDGKQDVFEKKFALVVEALERMPGHTSTHLYRSVSNRPTYLVVSEWEARAAFDAFVSSDEFRRVTAWGADNILASRPRHQVYGADAVETLSRDCPAHATAENARSAEANPSAPTETVA